MDYRFAIRCWQDQAGSENAKANVFVDGTQVATEVEITATSAASPQLITWESTGLADDLSTVDIKVVMTNEYYVDESTDRNITISGIGYIPKGAAESNYKSATGDGGDPEVLTISTVTDFTNFDNYINSNIPTAVTGDQIADDWWSSRDTDTFYYIVVWGSNSDTDGVTITLPV